MGIKRMTYRDIPSSLRARSAAEAQRRLQAVLSDPIATLEQRGDARRQQGVIREWVAGTLTPPEGSPEVEVEEPVPVSAVPAPVADSVDHTVVLEDQAVVDDETKAAKEE